MDISILKFLEGCMKAMFFFGGSGFLALWCLWPINDQPTSKTQWALWVMLVALLAVFMFTNWITFKR
jgi:hypothetical protein